MATRLWVIADQELAKIQATEPPCDCHEGCAHCCHRLVAATAPEVLSITSLVQGLEESQRNAVLERLEAYNEAAAPYWRFETDSLSAPCPFLVDDRCSIYDHRPLSCRSLNSYNADACQNHYLEGGPAISKPLLVPGQVGLVEVLQTSCSRAFLAAGQVSGLFDMPQAVRYLLRHPGESVITDNEAAPINRFKVVSERNGTMPLSTEAHRLVMTDAYGAWERRLSSPFEDRMAAVSAPGCDPLVRLFGRLAMPSLYHTEAEVEERWVQWGQRLEDLISARLDPKAAFEAMSLFDTFPLAYAGKNARPYLQKFKTYAHEAFAKLALPHLTQPIDWPRRPGRFRLGYAGYRMKSFNGSRWALGWLLHHSPDIETFVFNLNSSDDLTSAIWRRNADHYEHLPHPVSQVGERIRSLDLDALIIPDIGMDGVNEQLSLLRLARLQLTGWGHPVTSGSPCIDLYLSSEMMETPDADADYSEKLIRLPGSGLTYQPFVRRPSAKRASDFGLPETGFYLNAQYISKLLPSEDHLYREIGRRSGKPIVFLGPRPTTEYADEAFAARLRKADVPAIVLPKQDQADYCCLLALAEAVLDCPSWNGGNSTIEALSLGRPVVSLPGGFMRGRHALAFLPQAGVPKLIAKDEEDYIELALDGDRRREATRDMDVRGIFGDIKPTQCLDNLLLESMGSQ